MSYVKHVSTSIVLCGYLSACTPLEPIPVVSEAQRERLGTVGVVQIPNAPKGEVDVGPRSKMAGAAPGAAGGAAAGAAASIEMITRGSCSGFVCGVAIVLIPMFIATGAVIGAVGGAVGGAALAVPDDKARQIEAELQLALADVGSQQALRSEVVKTAARLGVTNVNGIAPERLTMIAEEVDYRKLSDSGIDTVLEVGLVEVGLNPNPKITQAARAC